MNTTASLLIWLAAALSFCSCAATPPAPAAKVVRLDDVQGLFGGQTLVIDANGDVFARKVIPTRRGLQERRYHLKLSSDELNALLAYIPSSGIRDYHERVRYGSPDEARPRITLALPNQKEYFADKWDGEVDPHFDKLYEKLLEFVERAAKT